MMDYKAKGHIDIIMPFLTVPKTKQNKKSSIRFDVQSWQEELLQKDSALVGIAAVQECGFKILQYLLCSRDIESSDYYSSSR